MSWSATVTVTRRCVPTSNTTRAIDDDEKRLERYLRHRAGDGDACIESKFIADDAGLTPSLLVAEFDFGDEFVGVGPAANRIQHGEGLVGFQEVFGDGPAQGRRLQAVDELVSQ